MILGVAPLGAVAIGASPTLTVYFVLDAIRMVVPAEYRTFVAMQPIIMRAMPEYRSMTLPFEYRTLTVRPELRKN